MWFPSLLLVIGSVFFVSAEYAMVSARRSRLESLARKGNKRAAKLVRALDNVSMYVAATQVGITMVGIGVGSITEPYVTAWFASSFGRIVFLREFLNPQAIRTIGFLISFVSISFVLVVIGELCPKYYALRKPEEVALATFLPIRLIVKVLSPIVWLAQNTAGLILRAFKIDIRKLESEAVPKEELALLVRAGGSEGMLEPTHAELLTRALKLDVLQARDIMIHRLDVKWVDASLNLQELLERLKEIPFNRLPVCRGDVDDVLGIVYVHDVVKRLGEPSFSLESVTRPVVAVPENLPLDRIVETMRHEKMQMLIVLDEYGGTSGLVTLEDVVEEVFGELEDTLESERPTIEMQPGGRVSARAEVRVDELVSFLKLNVEIGDDTDTLAQKIIDRLERVPKLGDTVETELGVLRVENMARTRLTRVSIQLNPKTLEWPSATDDEE